MPRFSQFGPQGVIRANLLPFKDDFSIDAKAFQRHVPDVMGDHLSGQAARRPVGGRWSHTARCPGACERFILPSRRRDFGAIWRAIGAKIGWTAATRYGC